MDRLLWLNKQGVPLEQDLRPLLPANFTLLLLGWVYTGEGGCSLFIAIDVDGSRTR